MAGANSSHNLTLCNEVMSMQWGYYTIFRTDCSLMHLFIALNRLFWSYFWQCTQFFRENHSLVAWMFSCRIVFLSFCLKAKENLQRCGDVFLDILTTSKGACFNAFRNFARSLNKRRMSPSQTMTTEWNWDKCLDKRMQSRQTPKHNL